MPQALAQKTMFMRIAQATHPSLPAEVSDPALHHARGLLPALVAPGVSLADLSDVATHVLTAGSPALAQDAADLFFALGTAGHLDVPGQSLDVPMAWPDSPCVEAGQLLRALHPYSGYKRDRCPDRHSLAALLLQTLLYQGSSTPKPATMTALHALCLVPDPAFLAPAPPSIASALAGLRLRRLYGMPDPDAARAVDTRLRQILDTNTWMEAFAREQADTLGVCLHALGALYAATGPSLAIAALVHVGGHSHHAALAIVHQFPPQDTLAGQHCVTIARTIKPLF